MKSSQKGRHIQTSRRATGRYKDGRKGERREERGGGGQCDQWRSDRRLSLSLTSPREAAAFAVVNFTNLHLSTVQVERIDDHKCPVYVRYDWGLFIKVKMKKAGRVVRKTLEFF